MTPKIYTVAPTWALVRLMSSLICRDRCMASRARDTLYWLNWIHSWGVEELQQRDGDTMVCELRNQQRV